MAQNYSELRKDNVRDAIYEDVANNLEVLRTSWAGNAFPENPKVGQACYRIDEDNLYFWDGTTWSQKGGGGIDMNTGDKLYDWVGTLAEYREQDIENQHPDYLCYITDDLVDSREAMTLPVGFIGLVTFPIDESLDLQKYANGQIIYASKFPELVKKLKSNPNLCVDEDTWQAEKTLSKLGQCGKYVLDEVAGTIRLPLIINAQGLSDLSLIGGVKAESLPNISGDFSQQASAENIEGNAFYSGNSGRAMIGTTWGTGDRVSIDASRSSSAYQDGAPVQQEAIQYPYFIQVATGVEESLPAIREYKLNNPHFFGESKWTDVDPNNASWLLSNGAYHSGKTYGDYYKWLTDIKSGNKVVEGVSVKSVDDDYTEYEWVINTGDETFRLPLKTKLASGSAVAGNGKTLGFTDGSGNNKSSMVVAGQISLVPSAYDSSLPSSGTDSGTYSNLTNVGITTDPDKSGIETSSNGLKLYFYIGDTLQDPALITATGVLKDIETLKQNKLDREGNYTVVETYKNGTEWYRVFSDGWVEQGGYAAKNTTTNFLKQFANTNYSVVLSPILNANGGTYGRSGVTGKTAKSFYNYSGAGEVIGIDWFACGQGA